MELRDLQACAESLAKEAGEVVLGGVDDAGGRFRTKTSVMDVVTATDTAAEQLIVTRIATAFPDDSILAEEGTSRSRRSGRRWIIDPIDGTVNFVRGWAASAVSIGIEIDGRVAVGVVYNPFRDELFGAAAGLGAFRNGKRLPLRTEKTLLAQSLVGVVGGYASWARRERAAITSRLLTSVGDIRYTGSAALDLCYVADGRLDACFGNGYKKWDFAAGAVIAQEAGCLVTGPTPDSAPTPDCLVAAIPELMPAFRSLVQDGLDEAGQSQA